MTTGGRPILIDGPTLPTAPYPPPVVGPNPVPGGGTAPADVAQGLLGAAGNVGVPGDEAASVEGEADRRAHALDAAQKFPANEADSAQQFQQLAQTMPQMASGFMGAMTGALGGFMGPLTQIPQQAMQAAQSAIQPLMGAAKGGGAAEAALTDMAGDSAVLDGADLGGGSGGGGLGAGVGTTPTGVLGPPPVPSSSPPTTPAAASVKPAMVTPTGGMPPAAGPVGMTGMPMMPGAMGAGGEAGNKDKPAEKRVTVPGIPNGQPVKGRLTVPPSVPVAKSEGKPPVVAKPNRRIVIVPADEEPPQE